MKMNQTLEDLLKPVKFLDEALLKQYTKLTQKGEAKGRSRYSLANKFNSPTKYSTGLFFGFSGGLVNYSSYLVGTLASLVTISIPEEWTIDESKLTEEVYQDSVKVEEYSPFIGTWKNVSKSIRLPLFVSGTSLMAKGGFDLINSTKTQNSKLLTDALSEISLGYTLFGNTSSRYVRDSDPKLLDKTPAWKTAYDFVKGKLSRLVPEPASQPVPVLIRVNYSLEDMRGEK